jgi:hypothetical protein
MPASTLHAPVRRRSMWFTWLWLVSLRIWRCIFAIRFSYASIAVDLILKIRQYMKRLHWILLLMILLIPTESISAKKKTEKSDREIWCDVMYRMAAPVLSNMSEGLLKQNMLVELSPTWDGRNQNVTYMECFGRLMAVIARR